MKKSFVLLVLTLAVALSCCYVPAEAQRRGAGKAVNPERNREMEEAIIKAGFTPEFVQQLRSRYHLITVASLIKEGYARVVIGDRQGLIDREGREVLPVEFDLVGHNNHVVDGRDNFLPIRKNNLYGCINKQGRIIVPCISEIPVEKEIEKQGYAPVKVNGKYGLVDTLGQYVIKPRYEAELTVMEAYDNGGFHIEVDQSPSRSGLVMGGKLILPLEYDNIMETFGGYMYIEKNGLRGLLSPQGVELLPCKYAIIVARENNYFEVNEGGQWIEEEDSRRFVGGVDSFVDGEGKPAKPAVRPAILYEDPSANQKKYEIEQQSEYYW